MPRWWLDERDPGPRPGKVKWDRFDDVAAQYPSIGNLTADHLDDAAAGALLRGLLMADMGIKARGGSQDPGRIGVNWPNDFDEAAALGAYEYLKDEMLTATLRIRWDRQQFALEGNA
jgi:hypothetical protein